MTSYAWIAQEALALRIVRLLGDRLQNVLLRLSSPYSVLLWPPVNRAVEAGLVLAGQAATNIWEVALAPECGAPVANICP